MADDEEKYAQRKAPQKPGAAKRPRKPRPVAVVLCNGNCELHGCEQGCVGCQACVNACRKGAISLNERGVAHVDQGARAATASRPQPPPSSASTSAWPETTPTC